MVEKFSKMVKSWDNISESIWFKELICTLQ